MRFKTWSYRFAEEILNSNLEIKKEIEEIVRNVNPKEFSRKKLNKEFSDQFLKNGWKKEARVVEELESKIDFIKNKVGVEVAFVHSSFVGIDILKFQVMSFTDKIDVGIYIVMTYALAKKHNATDSICFEKVKRYLPAFKSAIQVPIFVIGLEE